MSGTVKAAVTCRVCGHRLTKSRLPREKRSRWIDAWGSLNGVDGHRHKRVMPSKTAAVTAEAR